MIDIKDYRNYLSVDNGKGLLISKKNIEILTKYNIDYKNYNNLNSLIFDIDNYLNYSNNNDLEDLEEVLINLSEIHYYNETKK